MAGVKHANIVPIYTFDECDAGAYLAMEHCEGGSLAERIQDGITVGLAVETLANIARALEAAWKKGVVRCQVAAVGARRKAFCACRSTRRENDMQKVSTVDTQASTTVYTNADERKHLVRSIC